MARRAVVTDTDLGFDRIMLELTTLQNYSILVGIQEGSITTGQTRAGRKQEVGLNIAQYSAQNEFGTDKTPERSFMRTAFDENINVIRGALAEQLGLVVDGNKTIRSAFDSVGILVANLIQRKIRQIRSPPNSPETIARKGSSKPLIDFGAMIAAVRHVVRRRSGANT